MQNFARLKNRKKAVTHLSFAAFFVSTANWPSTPASNTILGKNTSILSINAMVSSSTIHHAREFPGWGRICDAVSMLPSIAFNGVQFLSLRHPPDVFFCDTDGFFSDKISENCSVRYTFFFLRKWSIRKWGYWGRKNKKVEGQNAPALRKSLCTRFKKF